MRSAACVVSHHAALETEGKWEGVTNVVLSSCRNYSIMAVGAVSTGARRLFFVLNNSHKFIFVSVLP